VLLASCGSVCSLLAILLGSGLAFGDDLAMRLLVLGGTSYLSKQVALDAVGRGHEVVSAALC